MTHVTHVTLKEIIFGTLFAVKCEDHTMPPMGESNNIACRAHCYALL